MPDVALCMRNHTLARLTILGLTLLAPPLGQPLAARERASARPLVLVGGTLYVGANEAPIHDGVIVVRDGRIAGVGRKAALPIPDGADVLDCTGLVVAPGFWNSHVHFTERKWADAAAIPADELAQQLRDMLTRYGFTSAFDTGSSWANTRRLRDRVESGEVAGPRIRSTGEIVFPKGGAPADFVLDVVGTMRVEMPEAEGAAQAAAVAKALLDAGTDGVKLYAATWAPPIVSLPEAAVRAAADEAHRRGKPVFAHPSNRAGLLAAVRGGADVIVHTTPASGPWDESILAAMTQAHVALVPTLKLWRYELRHDRAVQRDAFAAAGVAQLRAWRAAGGEVLFGTDVGYMDDYDPADEYALMADAGMTVSEILAALTTTPAARFGDGQRLGRIATGLVADLVVLNGDPALNVRALANVRYTLRDGQVIYAAGSSPEERAAARR